MTVLADIPESALVEIGFPFSLFISRTQINQRRHIKQLPTPGRVTASWLETER